MTSIKRAADLEVGDLTQHAGGSCRTGCPDNQAPWRVEKLEELPGGVDVTWSHPPCGDTAPPLSCADDCPLEFHGRTA